MTVKELFSIKYRYWLKNMTSREWENIKFYAEAKNMSIPDYMLLCLEITEDDIKNYGGYKTDLYAEIKEMHSAKFLASNCHRQEHGHIDKWWLTKKRT